eukprot:4289192-Prymnesium_polylepis.1
MHPRRVALLWLFVASLQVGHASTADTRGGGACSALAELEDEYRQNLQGLASAEIFNIVDPGTSKQCAALGVEARCVDLQRHSRSAHEPAQVHVVSIRAAHLCGRRRRLHKV